ncbi:MAG: hypothetical protein PHD03_03090 [Bacilli bacterium]|nr:hypothetical protein [Bacilli bacterium]MDD4406710.1 hypothetical protein [Bacilli bacterium]
MKKNNWIYKVFFMTFVLSIIFSTISNLIAYNGNLIIIFLLLILIISIGIMFDMIGTSVLTSKESTFHAMSSRKIKGAKEAKKILKNNVQISNLCLDIFGDICGILSGGLGAVLAIGLSNATELSITLASIIIGAIISSLTVGGKAVIKEVAIKNSDFIVFQVGKLYHFLRIK